ncbi:MAG TPA: M1 family metallopeptidase [Gemmatimonadaceae bacterium]|nr:M1 family metallopeptidase [Gemmatimonadaceae bacterium]
MSARFLTAIALPAMLALAVAPSNAQTTAAATQTTAGRSPERPVRRDIPMTRMIQRAFAAGTRDSTGRPGRNYWQLWTDYKINASLDPATSIVTGRETVTIRNNSDSAMRSLVLRLDQNFFTANVPRLEAASELTDGMQITRLVANGQAMEVTDTLGPQIPGTTRRAPPLSAILKNTSARITLLTPIAPHSTGTLEADWHFRVPRADNGRGTRMGRWADTLYQIGQWYPRVAVFDDMRPGGWDTEPYLGPAEFYNNYGHFDVSIDVPAGWIVGSTGVLLNPTEVLTPTARERLSHVLESDSVRTIVSAAERGAGKSTAAGNRLVWHFVADTVGDVAWATSNQYVWDATRATIPGRGPVPVNIFYLPGHTQQYARGGAVVRHALEFYSKLWMPYVYPQLTMVDGPELGMEYPMFIMSAVFAADHETGHQWWPMMVGVNETWYGWMDEGFNQYMNILSDADHAHQPAKLDSLGMSYGRISGNELEPPLMWDENYAGPLYGFAAYGKAPLMLSSLGGVVGDTAVQRAMSEYAKAWRFKHPSPWDYAFFMSNALHRDLGWFWNYWLFTTESVDGSIQDVKTAGRRTTVTVRQNGQMPSPVILKVEFAPAGATIKQMSNSLMTDAITAIVTYPVDVWFPGNRTFSANLEFGGRAITRITLDPNGRFPDRDLTDNVWPRTAPALTGRVR